MKVWIIEYCDAGGNVRDCYPDFCYSAGEAYRIAPEFMAAMAACGPTAHGRSRGASLKRKCR
jgi:hypothetical protein